MKRWSSVPDVSLVFIWYGYLKNVNLPGPLITTNIMRLHSLYLLVILITAGIPVRAASSCNPVVTPTSSDTTLIRTLTRLAKEYDFKLSLPVSLDRPVQLKKSMKLDRLVKYLTSNLNTVLKHKKIDSCATPVLTQIIILPVGKETDYVSIAQPASDQTEDYVYIENMELYVTNVLSGKQNADLGRMTPEQREEFKFIHETLEVQLAEESAQVDEINQPGVEESENMGSNPEGN